MFYVAEREERRRWYRSEGQFASIRSLYIRSYLPSQVYGTTNLRIVDLSILPLLHSAHTLSMTCYHHWGINLTGFWPASAYAIAEQGAASSMFALFSNIRLAADIIKARPVS